MNERLTANMIACAGSMHDCMYIAAVSVYRCLNETFLLVELLTIFRALIDTFTHMHTMLVTDRLLAHTRARKISSAASNKLV